MTFRLFVLLEFIFRVIKFCFYFALHSSLLSLFPRPLSSSGDVVRPAGVVCPSLPAQPLPGLQAPQEGLPGHRLQQADGRGLGGCWSHPAGLLEPGGVPPVSRGVSSLY